MINIGFCEGNRYTSTEAFASSGGFSFEPQKTALYISKTSYSDYSKARAVCDQLSGYSAIPVLAGNKKWNVAIPAVDDKKNRTDISAIENEYTDISGDKKRMGLMISVRASGYSFIIDPVTPNAFPQIKAVSSGKQVPVSLGTRKYRGRIEVIRDEKGLTAVNIVGIEAYLLGVVTCEMDSASPMEALKAQAVCARSFAASKAGFGADSNLDDPYTLEDTTASQVYKGYTFETRNSYLAVKNTSGQVIKDKNGSIVRAFYFSSAAGSTDSSYDIWGTQNTVFEPVFNIFETAWATDPWSKDFTTAKFADILRKAGYDIGSFISASVSAKTAGGRIKEMTVTGSSGTKKIPGTQLRDLLDLPSTKFAVIASSDNLPKLQIMNSEGIMSARKLNDCYAVTSGGKASLLDPADDQFVIVDTMDLYSIPASIPEDGKILIVGLGSGHGVGMSQTGAEGLAENGMSFKEIINYYYKGVSVGSIK